MDNLGNVLHNLYEMARAGSAELLHLAVEHGIEVGFKSERYATIFGL